MRSLATFAGMLAVLAAPQTAQAEASTGQASASNNPISVSNTAPATCTVGLWIAPKFDYDLQSLWGGVAGLVGQALADEANSDKLYDRRNELEKALPTEAVYQIITSANLEKIAKEGAIKFLPLQLVPPTSQNMKSLMLSKSRNSDFSGGCYYEIYVSKVSAYKTIVYGTFLDSKFTIKKFSGENVSGSYTNSIRRKILGFPAKTPEEIENSQAGVRKIFSEEFEFFLKNSKL